MFSWLEVLWDEDCGGDFVVVDGLVDKIFLVKVDVFGGGHDELAVCSSWMLDVVKKVLC
jgi:hypothetical protein